MPLYKLSTSNKAPLAILPMAVVLALHLVLVLLWANHSNEPASQDTGQRHISLTWLLAPQPLEPPPSPPPPRPARRAAKAVAPQPVVVPQAAVEPVVQVDLPQRDSAPKPTASGALDVNQLMDAAKRQVGAIDQELRAGKLAPLAPDRELPITRMRDALASAYIDRSRTTITETMRQADGVVVYRFRRGEKIWCRQSGSVGSSIERSDGAKLAGAGSAGGAGTAGTIPCPTDETGWSRL